MIPMEGNGHCECGGIIGYGMKKEYIEREYKAGFC
jgi:hypothetical protein